MSAPPRAPTSEEVGALLEGPMSVEQLEALAKLHRRIAALYTQAAGLRRQAAAEPAPPREPPDDAARALVRKKLLQKGYRLG